MKYGEVTCPIKVGSVSFDMSFNSHHNCKVATFGKIRLVFYIISSIILVLKTLFFLSRILDLNCWLTMMIPLDHSMKMFYSQMSATLRPYQSPV